jgi:hypothetical protein
MAKVSIHEVRRLVLPLETVVDAVQQLDRDRAGALSVGTIIEAQVESEPEPGLVLWVRSPGSGAVESRKLALPMIAAAIINYCWQSRIPLPRQGTKTLEIVPEGFAFTIETTLQVPRRHDALPVRPARKAEAVAAPAAASLTT